jgi:16S rRNA (cytosine967-C5)-methyltransferase
MSVSPARVTAFDVLLQVERADAYASELLHSRKYSGLPASDHGLATELVMGALRWQSLLDERIAAQSSQKLTKLDPEVLIALRLAAYQVLFLDRVPEHAAVHESVELVKRARKRSAVPFANAVLRKLASAGKDQKAAASPSTPVELAKVFAHPLWLVERWVQRFGFDAARKICEYDQKIPETQVRLPDPAIQAELESDGIRLAPGQLVASAHRVLSGDITRTRAFHEGRIVIQDEASQLVALLVGHGSTILDCCAAPGGKTRILAECNPDAVITAVELHPHRARLLQQRASAGNIRVIVADAGDLPLIKQYDRVLVDVPCSGTGTLARNPEIKWRLKPEDLRDLQSRQLRILRSAAERLAPGGKLIYASCSLEREENQEVVEQMLSGNREFRIADCKDQLKYMHADGELAWDNPDSLAEGPYLRTISGTHPCDGFFGAVLERAP